MQLFIDVMQPARTIDYSFTKATSKLKYMIILPRASYYVTQSTSLNNEA